MRRLGILAVLLGVGAISLAASPTAIAATEFGDACVANEAELPFSPFELSAPGNPLPTAAPAPGVITKWRVNLINGVPFSVPTAMKIVRLSSGSQIALVVGEAQGKVVSGANSFDARVPVQAGDRIAIFGGGPAGTTYCKSETGEKAQVGGLLVPGSTGQGVPFEQGAAEIRVPIVALLEPDVDLDGYGDETQDLCPQNAAFQTACPPVRIDAINIVGKNAVTLLVTAGEAAPVAVSGRVKLGKKGSVGLAAAAKTVSAGTLARFTLKFPAKLQNRLGRLSSKKKLTLKLSARATNAVGLVSEENLKAKLKGRKR